MSSRATRESGLDPTTTYDPDFFVRLAEIEDRHFWFGSRSRVIASMMTQMTTGLPPGYHVLEVGCGTGSVLRVLERVCRGGVVIGMDLFAEGLAHARRRSSCLVVQGNVHALPFRSAFHVIGLFDVLEHLPDDDAALRGLRDLLVPGGALLLSVPAHRCLWSYFDEASRHCRRYESAELHRKLDRAGYHVEYLTHYLATLFPIVWGWRRLASLIGWRPGDDGSARDLALRELQVVPILNGFLRFLLDQELRLIAGRKTLAIGTSLIAVCRKRR
jgi:SAM-dependent methyltransferase